MIEKIKKSFEDGSFILKIGKKLHSLFPIYYLKNKSLVFQQDIDYSYRKLKKQYKKVIEKGVINLLPSKSSNNIWICWFQGEEKAPELVKACIASARKNFPDREIIILTDENLYDYINLPEYILQKREKGIIPNAQFSDLIRVELLCNYGGLWIDATVLVTENSSKLLNNPLFVYRQLDLTRLGKSPIVASNWLIYANSNNNILLLTRELLWKYWKEKNVLENYFIFHIFFTIATERYPEQWEKVPIFNNHSPHTLHFELNNEYSKSRWEEIIGMSSFHKLNHHLNYSGGKDTFYKFIIESYKENVNND